MKHLFFLIFLFIGVPLMAQKISDQTNKLNKEAETLYRAKNYKAAIAKYQELLELRSDLAIPQYNLACTAALDGNFNLALSSLKGSIENGYLNKDHINKDTDLAILQASDQWVDIIKLIDEKITAIQNDFKNIASLPIEKIIPFTKNKKWGYIHSDTDSILIPAKYAKAAPFGGCFIINTAPGYKLSVSKEGIIFKLQRPYYNLDKMDFDDFFEVVPFKDYEDDKAFEYDSNGRVKSVSSKYITISTKKEGVEEIQYETDEIIRSRDPVEGKTIRVEGVLMDNNEPHILLRVNNKPLLINQKGESPKSFNSKYESLYHLPRLVNGEQWFYYIEIESKKKGFVNFKGERRFHGEQFNLRGPYVEWYNLVKTKKDGKEGFIDLGQMEYLIEPQNYKIINMSFIHSDECGLFTNLVSPLKMEKKLFLMSDGNEEFYMDENGKEYRNF